MQVNVHVTNSQLELRHSVGRHDETQVKQPTHRQVEVEPAGVVVGIEPIAQVRPAGVQRCNALQLGPAETQHHASLAEELLLNHYMFND